MIDQPEHRHGAPALSSKPGRFIQTQLTNLVLAHQKREKNRYAPARVTSNKALARSGTRTLTARPREIRMPFSPSSPLDHSNSPVPCSPPLLWFGIFLARRRGLSASAAGV